MVQIQRYEYVLEVGERHTDRYVLQTELREGNATHFDLVNAAERVYLTLSANPYRYGERANVSLPE